MIKKLHFDKRVHAAEIPELFRKEGVVYESIDILNWPEAFPYKPVVEFAVAHSGDSLLIHYKVDEKTAGAVCGEDGGHVWEDSCVEFFCRPDNSLLGYYNLESNCIGKILLAYGPDRADRTVAPKEVMESVERWSSLGSVPFKERATGPWELCLIVPASAFFRHSIKSFDAKTLKVNFYKCGDKLQTPHFLSYAPIQVPNPDFHRPEFFVSMELE